MEQQQTYADVAPIASVGKRFLAILIDGLILGLISSLLFGAAREVGGGVSFAVTLLYYWYFWTRQDGQSPGKNVMNLRVVKADGSPLSDVDAIVRVIGYYINTAILLIGWIWALFDHRSRGLHDLIAGTIVIEDEKRK